jgi:hypothetical protein
VNTSLPTQTDFAPIRAAIAECAKPCPELAKERALLDKLLPTVASFPEKGDVADEKALSEYIRNKHAVEILGARVSALAARKQRQHDALSNGGMWTEVESIFDLLHRLYLALSIRDILPHSSGLYRARLTAINAPRYVEVPERKAQFQNRMSGTGEQRVPAIEETMKALPALREELAKAFAEWGRPEIPTTNALHDQMELQAIFPEAKP